MTRNQQNAAAAMKAAWQIARKAAAETGKKASLFFRESLRQAWAEIKNQNNLPELPELVGSAKQIAWANDLRPQILEKVAQAEKELENGINQCKDALTAENWAEINSIKEIFAAIRNAKHASTFIDLTGYCKGANIRIDPSIKYLGELSSYVAGRTLHAQFKAGYIK